MRARGGDAAREEELMLPGTTTRDSQPGATCKWEFYTDWGGEGEGTVRQDRHSKNRRSTEGGI